MKIRACTRRIALTVAQTGRLSSNDPNLQNIPTRTDLGRRIRTAFVAGKGNKLVSADYSQFELRLAAVLAKDKELIEMFNRGADIHSTTAAQVYGREQEDVTKQHAPRGQSRLTSAYSTA